MAKPGRPKAVPQLTEIIGRTVVSAEGWSDGSAINMQFDDMSILNVVIVNGKLRIKLYRSKARP